MLQDDVNVYRSMPPMPDILRPSHTLLRVYQQHVDDPDTTRLDHDPVTSEEEDSNDGRTLADLKQKRSKGTS